MNPEPPSLQSPDETREQALEVDVSPRDLEVLKTLSEDVDKHWSFQGLRRKLGLHQEALSRSLKRLSRDDLIQKVEGEYEASEKGLSLIGAVNRAVAPTMVPLAQTYLPSDVELDSLAEELKTRWFANLRWLGSAEIQGGRLLSWITEDGALQLNLRLTKGFLSIETPPLRPDQFSTAVKEAHILLDQIVNTYRHFGREPPQLYRNN